MVNYYALILKRNFRLILENSDNFGYFATDKFVIVFCKWRLCSDTVIVKYLEINDRSVSSRNLT